MCIRVYKIPILIKCIYFLQYIQINIAFIIKKVSSKLLGFIKSFANVLQVREFLITLNIIFVETLI